MSEWPARLAVARWEFQRFMKPGQLVVSLVIMLLLGAFGYGVARWAGRSNAEPVQVAMIGGHHLQIDSAHTIGNIALTPARPAALDSLRTELTARNLDGIVILESADAARLIVRRAPAWSRVVESHLAESRQRLRLGEAGLDQAQLASLLAPVAVITEFQSGTDGRGARIVALLAVGLVLYGVFTSMAYMMVSVTAEKQLRVTEQVVSAISPQTWIDGKILGISAVALVNVVVFVASAALWMLGRSIATGATFSMGTAEPAAIVWIILFAMLGFAFWLVAFGAIAATIDDPNTSTRGPMMFLPAMFSIPGFLIIGNPDSGFARIASIIPFSSSAVMPARVALTEVPLWELLLAAALLIGGALLARRAAGRVFSVAMLMYGKEPSWKEIRRWAGES